MLSTVTLSVGVIHQCPADGHEECRTVELLCTVSSTAIGASFTEVTVTVKAVVCAGIAVAHRERDDGSRRYCSRPGYEGNPPAASAGGDNRDIRVAGSGRITARRRDRERTGSQLGVTHCERERPNGSVFQESFGRQWE